MKLYKYVDEPTEDDITLQRAYDRYSVTRNPADKPRLKLRNRVTASTRRKPGARRIHPKRSR